MTTDPSRVPSIEELGAWIQQLAVHVTAIHERLERLEQRERERAGVIGGAPPQAPAVSGATLPPAAIPGVTAATPTSFVAPASPASPGWPSASPAVPGAPWAAPVAATPPRAPWWQVGPLQTVTADKAPIVALAAAGGLAVLVGMLFFVWYAVDRGWLSPITRLWLGGAAGLAMLVAAWPLADRNRAAAGGLGGAGLGTWFGVWIVARHVHGVVDAPTTFAGLAAVAAACLVVAGLRQLRLMAILGALAAFVTPIATATGSARLHELMAYQLVVMAALVALEHVRRWPELGHIALVGTWLLVGGWAQGNIGPTTVDPLLGWAVVLLVVASAQAVLLRLRGLAGHAAGRQLVGGLLAWGAAVTATWDRPSLLAGSTLGMAVWHLAVLGGSRSRGASPGFHAVLLGLAWAQLFAFGPLRFEGTSLPAWWLAQGLAGALTVAVARGGRPVWLAAAPLLGVAGWVSDATPGDVGLRFGLAVAAVLVVIAVWPAGRAPDVEAGEHEPDGVMAAFLFTLAALVAGGLAELHLVRPALAPLAVLGVGLAGSVRALVRIDPQRVRGTVVALALALAWAVGHVALDGLLRRPEASAGRAAVAAAAGLVGALALVILLQLRRRPRAFAALAELHDVAGVLVVVGPAVALQLLVTSWLYAQWLGHPGLGSLVLAGMSVIGAVAALVGLVAGLRFQREAWRKLALVGLVAVAVKLVLVDLSEVDVAYRVLSFVGLGACMLLGAIAYGRALRRHGPPEPRTGVSMPAPSPSPTDEIGARRS